MSELNHIFHWKINYDYFNYNNYTSWVIYELTIAERDC